TVAGDQRVAVLRQRLSELLVGEPVRSFATFLLGAHEIFEDLPPLRLFGGFFGAVSDHAVAGLRRAWRSSGTCWPRARTLRRRARRALGGRNRARYWFGARRRLTGEAEGAQLRLVGNVPEHLLGVGGTRRHASLRGHGVDPIVE